MHVIELTRFPNEVNKVAFYNEYLLRYISSANVSSNINIYTRTLSSGTKLITSFGKSNENLILIQIFQAILSY